uniref:UPAR/Ly6 domain-containing protein n=1 Tax=Periophthalmus magnuspinnatus TaxID=409849 RepID=A0A3B4B9F7_9GOBI
MIYFIFFPPLFIIYKSFIFNVCFVIVLGSTYSSCVNYNHCDFDSLSLKYPQFPQFKFSCCQSNLCNGRSITEKIKDFFTRHLTHLPPSVCVYYMNVCV